MSPKRILLYGQSLSGVGHDVRLREIARALVGSHEVYRIQGGRAVPGPIDPDASESVELPRIRRGARGLEPVAPGASLEDVMRARAGILRDAAARIAPDVVLVEHYPFSKWELEAEIQGLLDAAHAANRALRCIACVRDICPKTRHESVSAADFERRVADTLNHRFDALFVHCDPSFTRLDEHFGAVHQLSIPVRYAGFVSQKPSRPAPPREARVVVSSGGGAASTAWVARIVAAWAQLRKRGTHGGRRLVVFPGLFWSKAQVERLRAQAEPARVEVAAWSVDFPSELAASELSISRAGYNTCTNLLETRSRALLLPDHGMSDQLFRARRLAALGLVTAVFSETPEPDALAEAIELALRQATPEHSLDLEGALTTRRLIEEL